MAIDIGAIKTNFKTVMDAANSVAADYDLSTGLTTRVAKVLTVNPVKIPIQPSFFPYVTIFATRKTVTLDTIARDQQNARRMAEVFFTIVGAVWEPITSDPLKDASDDQCEKLMENIEEVIRRNFRLSTSAIISTKPTDVRYHSIKLDEEALMRAGDLTLSAKIQY